MTGLVAVPSARLKGTMFLCLDLTPLLKQVARAQINILTKLFASYELLLLAFKYFYCVILLVHSTNIVKKFIL